MWKESIENITKESTEAGTPLSGFEVDFNSFPVLTATWDIFELSINLITHSPTQKYIPMSNNFSPAKQGNKKTKPCYAVSIKEAAGKLRRSEHTVAAWVNGRRKQPEGFPGLNDSVAFYLWAEQYVNQKAARKEIRRMGKARNYSHSYIEDHARYDQNEDYTPKINE